MTDNNTPLVSVIVPVYNAEKYLNRCVDSILSQTMTDFELLLIDDGSKDDSGRICDEYSEKDARVRVFHKPNGGVSSARNLGLDNAEGKWITFCDADDVVLPSWLSNFIDNACDSVDYVVQGFLTDKTMFESDDIEFTNRRKFSFSFEGTMEDGLLLMSKNTMLGYVWCKLFRYSIIKQFGVSFNEAYNYQEDIIFNLSYLQHCKKIKSIDDAGYCYFVPDWGSKYTDKANFFELNRDKYLLTQNIFGDKINSLTSYHLSAYVASLFLLFKKNVAGRRSRLIEFRKKVGVNVLRSKVFFVTKWAIFLDFTYLISPIVIWLHTRMKNIPELE